MIISNMTLKEKNELLTTLWDDLSVTLHGVKDGVTSSIDRDQVVDDGGVALYDSYQFLLSDDTDDGLFVFFPCGFFYLCIIFFCSVVLLLVCCVSCSVVFF